MTIDAPKVLGAPATEVPDAWDKHKVILYHLGLGAGCDPMDERELQYVLEDRLKVLPTFGVLASSAGASAPLQTPGLVFNPALMLHGGQSIELHSSALPTDAKVLHSGRIAELWDKGSAAVCVLEVTTTSETGELLCTNRFSMFLRGAGGFGGDPGPTSEGAHANATPPRWTLKVPTLPQQALLYRMSGDTNPLHSDPEIARSAGLDRPILHGQCWYGMTCKALVDNLLEGDVAAVRSWSARFAGSIYPGETLILSCWREDDRITVVGDVAERNSRVLTSGVLVLNS